MNLLVVARTRHFAFNFLCILAGAAASFSTARLLNQTGLSLSAQASRKTSSPVHSAMSSIDRMTSNKGHRSVEGRSIDVIQVRIGDQSNGTTEAAHRFLVQGGLHGDEKLPPKFILWLASRVARGESALNLLPLERFDIDFLPNANPDGDAANTRTNKAGINLNRNFGVLWGYSRENPGAASFSEPETKAIEALFQKRKYTASVDVHGYIKWLVAPSAPQLIGNESSMGTDRLARYKNWIKSLSQVTGFLGSGYKLQTAGGLGDGGAFEDWAFWKADSLSFCLELASAERFTADKSTATFQPAAYGSLNAFRSLGSIVENANKTLPVNSVDSFLTYEHAIFMAFSEALEAGTVQTVPKRPQLAE